MERFLFRIVNVLLSLLLPLDVSWVFPKKFPETCAGHILASKLSVVSSCPLFVYLF